MLRDVSLAVRQGLSFLEADLRTQVEVRCVVGEGRREVEGGDRDPPDERLAERLGDRVEGAGEQALPMVSHALSGQCQRVVGNGLLEAGLERGVRVQAPGVENLLGGLAILPGVVERRVHQVGAQRNQARHLGLPVLARSASVLRAVQGLHPRERVIHLQPRAGQRGCGQVGDRHVELGGRPSLDRRLPLEERDLTRPSRRVAAGQRDPERHEPQGKALPRHPRARASGRPASEQSAHDRPAR